MDHKTFKKLPQELCSAWSEDERMDFLFSAFPPTKSDNPEHWNSKMNFWENLIMDLYQHSTSVCLELETIIGVLKRDGKVPLGINVVWETMIQQKKIILDTEYAGDMCMNSTWHGWSYNSFIRKPIKWVAEKTLSPLKQKRSVGECYVSVPALESKCHEVLHELQSSTEAFAFGGSIKVLQYNALLKSAAHIARDKKSMDFILLALEVQKKIVVFCIDSDLNNADLQKAGSEKFIKFSNSSLAVDNATETELDILKLWQSKISIEESIKCAYRKQKDLQDLAKQFVHNKQHILAKNALRQKQRITKGLARKEAFLNQLEEILERINQAKVNAVVVAAYKAGVSAYDQFTKEHGLTLNNVEDTYAKVQSMMDDHNEISSTLASNLNDDNLDEQCEEELRELLGENKDKSMDDVLSGLKNLKVEDLPLPDVPHAVVGEGDYDHSKSFTYLAETG